MGRDIRIVLTEIIDAISLAREATNGLTLPAFEKDRIRGAAAERALEVISEAVRHLPVEITDRHQQLPWSDIRNIGNKLRHEYHRVDRKIVLDVIQCDLDGLETADLAELGKAP